MKIDLSLAEDIRMEINNKVTLVGYIPGARMKIRAKISESGQFEKKLVVRSSILLSIAGAKPGSNQFKMHIETPDAKHLNKTEGQFVSTGMEERNNLVFHIPMLSIEAPGEFVVHLEIDGKDYPNMFWIDDATPNASN